MNDLKKFIATTIREYLNEQQEILNNIWYHGSKEKFDKFKLKQGTLFDIDYTSPIFLTSNIEFAKYYASGYSPYIYKIKVLTNNIMDFRQLPSTNDILMYYEKNKINNDIDIKFYDIGKKLLDFIYENWDNGKYNFYWSYPERCYDSLTSIDYSEVERTWVYDWLKQEKYDGAYIIETKELNLLIFDETKLKILSIEAQS